MAVSGVKAYRMLFENGEPGSSGGMMAADQKDTSQTSKPVPPVLQKFMQSQQQAGSGRPALAQKPGAAKWGKPITKQNGGDASEASKPETESSATSTPGGATKPSAGKVGGSGAVTGRVNVANMFLHGAAPPPLKPVVPVKKPLASNSETTATAGKESSEPARPKVALKPPKPSAAAKPGLKPLTSQNSDASADSSATSSDKSPPDARKLSGVAINGGSPVPGPIKLPSLDGKIIARKTDSSTSSASTASSASSSKMSTSSVHSDDTSGPLDFRSRLRKTSGAAQQLAGTEGGRAMSNNNNNSNSNRNSNSDNSSSNRNSNINNSISNNNNNKTDTTKDVSLASPSEQDTPATTTHQVDSVKRRSSQDAPSTTDTSVVERPSDKKRFKKVDLSTLTLTSQPAPAKPALPEGGVDLAQICQQHARLLQDISKATSTVDDEEDDGEMYTDGMTMAEMIQPAPATSQPNRESNRVSLIPEMSAEDEGFDIVYEDGQTEQPEVDILYVDAASESKSNPPEDEETEDIYEDENEIMSKLEESEEDRKKRLKEEMEAKKREEKKRREEEKKKRQEEKEEQKRRKKFNLTGEETSVGEGVIKEDAKGRNMLTVKKGQMVTIIRLNDNPANRWLVRTDTDMGYVESSNIEIDTSIIRQAMVKERKDSALSSPDKIEEMSEEEDQPVYDPVAAESEGSSPREGQEGEDTEEIYELVS